MSDNSEPPPPSASASSSNPSAASSSSQNDEELARKKKTEEVAVAVALERLRIDANNSSSSSSSCAQQVDTQQQKVVAAQHLLGSGKSDVMNLLSGGMGGAEDRKRHAFWDTQPMILDESNTNNNNSPFSSSTPPTLHAPIVPDKSPSSIRQTPYNMPKGFEWSSLDINSPTDKTQIYELLANNYVEDDDCLFRFDYSSEFLTWALTPPEYDPAFHLGVRSTKSGRLMALITGVPATVRAYDTVVEMVEINFLCVHKKLRSKRLAPVLIKEITRRVNLAGIFQAVYTAGVVLPTPVATCRYYHRSLDPKKLVEINFSRIPPRMTLARMQKLYRLPEETTMRGLVKMEEEHVVSAHQLLVRHLEKFKLTILFSVDEFRHWFFPREGVISSFVACNDEHDEQKVTDLISFYHLPSTIIGNPKHSHLNAAYSFYNVATSVDLVTLMKDALTLAKYEEDMDVFNALSQMENEEVLGELKFGVGDGNLNYYLYNWCCPTLKSEDVGIVLL